MNNNLQYENATSVEQAQTRTAQARTTTLQDVTQAQQAETQTQQDETRTKQARTGSQQDETRTQQARTGSQQDVTQVEQMETRTEQNETRTEQAKTGSQQDVTQTEQAETQTQQEETRTQQARTGSQQDVTHAEQARTRMVEVALRASEERYRSLYNSMDEGFCVIEMLFDGNGRPDDYCFLEVNPAFEKQTGMRDVLGKRMRELVPDHDRFWFETYGKVALTGEPIRVQKKAEAMYRWFDVYAFRLGGPASVTVAVLFTDITARKLEEEKNKDLNVWLEQRVAERTAQLKTANEELETFSYSVSHDLRAPLRHVMGFVNLLQKDAASSLSEKNLKHLTTISDAARRMGNLIDDLLDFSRVGRAMLNKTSVQLDELVQETVNDFQEETRERKIVWEIWPLPTVCADRALLRLVLVNLISNALKFTGHRAEAKIEIVNAPGNNGETVIFIRDNGAGFDPSYVHKLFGVFQRLHSNAEFEGTGIGLANVQRIIHRHGGRVWAEGGVDAGATFYFSIPKQINGDTNGH